MSTVVITSKTPCACCGGATCLTTRSKGSGQAQLTGFPQFDSSVPPRAYKTWNQAGTMILCGPMPVGCPCTFPSCSYRKVTMSGSCGFGGSSAQAAVERWSLGTGCGSGGILDSTNILSGCFSPFVDRPCTVTEVKTQTSWSVSGNGTCCPDGTDYFQAGGGQAITLTNEFTDADAIAAVDALAWSAWGSVVNAILQTSDRTTYAFPYRPVQWRVNKGGFAPGNYKVDVQFWRRPSTGGAFTLLSTTTATATVGLDGIFDAEGDVPNADGFETQVRCACVIVHA